jgi:hypothetical protein
VELVNKAVYQYGLPMDIESLKPDLDAGRIRLGGCSIFVDSPRYHCNTCDLDWGVSEIAILCQEFSEQREQEDRLKDAEALKRGRMTAKVNAYGFACCPYCGDRFPINSDQFWDGDMHKPCRTRLQLESPDGNQP